MKQSRTPISRRTFLESGSRAAVAATLSAKSLVGGVNESVNSSSGSRTVEVLNPKGRVPLSFIIDDSTCLVNMGHFCMPQFAEAWPDRDSYRKPWKSWPREIPDAFVREFGEWCAEHGVKGKYSIVPYPACVGWLDRELPGWSRKELQSSLTLVRELMVPNWDIHPEMISHTRVIDLKTGRPIDEISAATMENSYPQVKKSVDELASYLAYALKILQNCDLPCEGITTPGGFGNMVKEELPLAVFDAVREVYRSELPHYFKYVSEGDESTEPVLEGLSGQGTDDLRVTVNVPAGTGDWFGNWDGDSAPETDRYCNRDASAGRLVELIEKGQPGTFLCHWPGMYTHGTKQGFEAFKQVVTSLGQRYAERTVWMKVSEIARYWAARKLTEVSVEPTSVSLQAPFACPGFTVGISGPPSAEPAVEIDGNARPLKEVPSLRTLTAGTWTREDNRTIVCIDLPKGSSKIRL